MTSIPLSVLEKDPCRHAWVLQDLRLWPDSSRNFALEDQGEWAYVHWTGHPSQRRNPAVMIDGPPHLVKPLLKYLPTGPFVVRESDAAVKDVVIEARPTARVFHEERMDVSAATFRPAPIPHIRRLTADDAPFVARFFGAPPAATEAFVGWLQGAAAFMGAFEGDTLQALGSTAVSLPEVWGLIAIETRPEARGRGFATQVTSALTQFALEKAPVVSLTMVTDNAPARKVYERLGYRTAQNRIWIDVGTGATP